jgi:hypothetical protein
LKISTEFSRLPIILKFEALCLGKKPCRSHRCHPPDPAFHSGDGYGRLSLNISFLILSLIQRAGKELKA